MEKIKDKKIIINPHREEENIIKDLYNHLNSLQKYYPFKNNSFFICEDFSDLVQETMCKIIKKQRNGVKLDNIIFFATKLFKDYLLDKRRMCAQRRRKLLKKSPINWCLPRPYFPSPEQYFVLREIQKTVEEMSEPKKTIITQLLQGYQTSEIKNNIGRTTGSVNHHISAGRDHIKNLDLQILESQPVLYEFNALLTSHQL